MTSIRFAVLFLISLAVRANAVPPTMDYQGYFEDGGVPVGDTHDLRFALYTAMDGGDSLWGETRTDVPFDRGLFSVKLGSVTPLALALFQHPEVYLQVTLSLDGEEFATRTKLASVPYAFLSDLAAEAAHAASADFATHAAFADSAGNGGGGQHWTANGDDIHNTNAGRIGFGTSSPEYKFHFDGGSATWPLYVRGSKEIMLVDGFGEVPLTARLFQVSNAPGSEVTVLGNGNLGVGTITPGAKLSVSGPAGVTTAIRVGENPPGYAAVDLVQESGQLSRVKANFTTVSGSGDTGYSGAVEFERTEANGGRIHLSTGTNALSRRITVEADGSVGIGTTNPQERLHVNGNFRASGTILAANGVAGFTGGSDLILRGRTGGSAIALIDQGGYLEMNKDWLYAGGLYLHGPLRHDGELNKDGYRVTNMGSPVNPNDAATKEYVDTHVGGGAGYWGANGSSIYNTNSGNVGIGTNAPDSKLQVLGSAAGLDPLIRITNTGTGHGILVRTGNGSGANAALEGQTMFTGIGGGTGVRGITSGQGSPTGSAVGVAGIALNTLGNGGSTIGVLGKTYLNTNSGTSLSVGVQGQATGTETHPDGEPVDHDGRAVGVIGDTWSYRTDMFGVRGSANAETGKTYGVIGETKSNANYSAGVRGVAGRDSGITYGVVGACPSPQGYGVYSEGRMGSTEGFFSLHGDGRIRTLTYVPSGARNYVENSGEGRLTNGRARVELDAEYLALVSIADATPLTVTVTFYGSHGEGWYVRREVTSFEVIDPSGSDAVFSWEVKAIRRGFEGKRLEQVVVSLSSE